MTCASCQTEAKNYARGICKRCYGKTWASQNQALCKEWQCRYKQSVKGRYKTLQMESKKRGLSVNLPFDRFVRLLAMPCRYCGEIEKEASFGYRLDRIDNTKGYFEENVVPCCASCNRIKGEALTFDEMLVAMNAVCDFRKRALV